MHFDTIRKENGLVLELGNRGSLWIFSYRLCDFPPIFLTLALVTLAKGNCGSCESPRKCRLWRTEFILVLGWGRCSLYISYWLVFAVADTLLHSLMLTKARIYPGNHKPLLSKAKARLMLWWCINTSSVWANRRGCSLLESSHSPHSMLAHHLSRTHILAFLTVEKKCYCLIHIQSYKYSL